MTSRILKKDILRNKIITFTLFIFIMLAAMLVSGGINIITTLTGSMDGLFEKARIPHFMQMHTGTLNQQELDAFTQQNPVISSQETVVLLGIANASLFLINEDTPENRSITENSFVKQNEHFDFLLDMDNQRITLQDGEIGVPIYHMQEYGLAIGDQVWYRYNDYTMEFVITAFVRDSQMNPGIVTSKRFLVSDGDFEKLKEQIDEEEFLIEFRLHDQEQAAAIEGLYQQAGLPASDTSITYSLYQLMSALTDGIVAGIIIFISLLLVGIAALCLRFTLITTIEEDYREIGVMKGIGIASQDICKLYMMKYVLISALSCLSGYLASILLSGVFIANITLFMGIAEQSLLVKLLPALGVLLVFGLIILFCLLVLRRFKRITPVAALGEGTITSAGKTGKGFTLRKAPGNLNIYMGMKAVFSRLRVYGPLGCVFFVCAFLMILPLNLLNTIDSPAFITYMGAGYSDFRIDLQNSQQTADSYQELLEYLASDREVAFYGDFTTASYKVVENGAGIANLKIENGDFSLFPLEYTKGQAPVENDEIALSIMNAEELEKDLGDQLILLVDGEEYAVTICGIYQDVTNGGKTAKGLLPYEEEQILWHVINVTLTEGAAAGSKADEYQRAFPAIKITDMDEYVSQTLGGIIRQLSLVTKLAMALAILIGILITALFFRMHIARDFSQIAIMSSLGLTYKDIRQQYITAAFIVSLTGVVFGILAAFLLGPGLAGLLLTGVSSIRFTVNPIVIFIGCPLLLTGGAIGTVMVAATPIRQAGIRDIIK